ncbi:hypothetical protein P7C70_g8729, partial [Phenoliferia sp. Uapishka_3]
MTELPTLNKGKGYQNAEKTSQLVARPWNGVKPDLSPDNTRAKKEFSVDRNEAPQDPSHLEEMKTPEARGVEHKKRNTIEKPLPPGVGPSNPPDVEDQVGELEESLLDTVVKDMRQLEHSIQLLATFKRNASHAAAQKTRSLVKDLNVAHSLHDSATSSSEMFFATKTARLGPTKKIVFRLATSTSQRREERRTPGVAQPEVDSAEATG